MLKLSVSDNRASSGCSCACVPLSPPATQLLQPARGMCNVSRAGGESVWPASISAKRLFSRGHVFGTVTVFAPRERMKIVCSFKYGAAEEGKSLQKVRSDDGLLSERLKFTPHTLCINSSDAWTWGTRKDVLSGCLYMIIMCFGPLQQTNNWRHSL